MNFIVKKLCLKNEHNFLITNFILNEKNLDTKRERL